MASFNERIAVTIDVVTDKATKGLKDFKSSVKDADGVTGKLKAGTKSLGDTFRGAAANPAILAGGVAALGTVALQAVGEFSDLGVEIGKFSDATGLATEEASRWVEVAGDLGIDTGTLEGALNKMNKAIDPKLFAELGVQIAQTSTGATDVNATFLNVIDRLKGIKDPAERAAAGTKLLGRSWTGLAELIQQGSSGLKKSLDSVADAKVLNKNEVQKARDFRDAQDNLKDVFEELVITIGTKLAPALSDAANSLSDIANDAKPAIDVLGKANEVANKGTGFFTGLFDAVTDIPDVLSGAGAEMTLFGNKINIAAEDAADFGAQSRQAAEYVDTLTGRAAANVTAMDDNAEATKRAHEATRELRQAIEGLNDIQLDSLAAKTDVVTQTFELAMAQDDYNAKVAEGKAPTAELAVEANTLAQEAADLAKRQGEVNGHTQTATERSKLLMDEYNRMQSTLKVGSPLWNAIEAYIAQLARIPANIETSLSITGAGRGTANRPSTVTGGGGQMTVDGERQTRSGQTVVNVFPRQVPTQREAIQLAETLARRQGR